MKELKSRPSWLSIQIKNLHVLYLDDINVEKKYFASDASVDEHA